MEVNGLVINSTEEYTYSQENGLQAGASSDGEVVTGAQVTSELKDVNSFGEGERQEMQQMYQEMIQQEQQENNEGNDVANTVSVIN